jgi:hypothetical protein
MTPMFATGPHPYLRAFMAGIAIPTAFLLVILTVSVTVHQFHREPLPIDRVLVFPMAIAPNLWGAWNMLYVAIRRTRYWPLGRHGVLLALIVGPLAWSIAHALGVPMATVNAAVVAYPFGVVMYYLLWKYGVRRLNEILGIA